MPLMIRKDMIGLSPRSRKLSRKSKRPLRTVSRRSPKREGKLKMTLTNPSLISRKRLRLSIKNLLN